MRETTAEWYLGHTLRLLVDSDRNRGILIGRIIHHRTIRDLAAQCGLSQGRAAQIINKFWMTLWRRLKPSRSCEEYRREVLDLSRRLERIRLYNPARVADIVGDNESRLVREYDFSVRAMNCLYEAGIRNMAQLVGRTEEDLLKIPKLGKRTVAHIKDLVLAHGYTLGHK